MNTFYNRLSATYKHASDHVTGEVANSNEEPEEAKLDGRGYVLIDVAINEGLKKIVPIKPMSKVKQIISLLTKHFKTSWKYDRFFILHVGKYHVNILILTT